MRLIYFGTVYSETLPPPFLFFNYPGIQPAEVSLGLEGGVGGCSDLFEQGSFTCDNPYSKIRTPATG